MFVFQIPLHALRQGLPVHSFKYFKLTNSGLINPFQHYRLLQDVLLGKVLRYFRRVKLPVMVSGA